MGTKKQTTVTAQGVLGGQVLIVVENCKGMSKTNFLSKYKKVINDVELIFSKIQALNK